ncbi:glycosyltransferase involved in cell wall biosynthesis [Pedobacter sp. UYP30]|uniref:glycosyltransferase family 2 protein n=1 Tax=Pedobacter sp. UYP30 TaxID=1756400 RepID=UPI003399B198
MPQTTILLPTYNCAKYILKTVESVLNQSYSNYELLIIDDGSTDNTEEIVKSISDKRIVYLKNSKNLGIVKTLNKGIKLAKGKYIARMDADDIMLGNRLQEQINFLEVNPEHGMVGSWYQIMDVGGKIRSTLKTTLTHEDIKLALLFGNQFAHPAVTIRTDLVRKLKYSQEFLYTEDYDLWCRMAEVSKLANLPKIHLSYRWYANNSCSRNQRELKANVVKLLSRELDKYEIEHSTEELMLHAAICFNYGKRFFNSEDRFSQLNRWLDKVFSASKVKVLHNRLGILICRQQILAKIYH